MSGRGPYLYQISVSDGGVPKLPVAEAMVTFEGLVGDRQRNRKHHGGRDRAVCLFSREMIAALEAEGHPIVPGATGENLTLAGLDWATVRPGAILAVGPAVRLEIMSYTDPCRWNAQWFVSDDFMRISQDRHPGWSRVYARVLTEGLLRAGDPVRLEGQTGMAAEGPT